MMKKTKCVLAVIAAVMLVWDAQAAMLDLAGTDMTVADVVDLASYEGVTNSSATAATLTFNIADDQTYAMTIGGKSLKFGSMRGTQILLK